MGIRMAWLFNSTRRSRSIEACDCSCTSLLGLTLRKDPLITWQPCVFFSECHSSWDSFRIYFIGDHSCFLCPKFSPFWIGLQKSNKSSVINYWIPLVRDTPFLIITCIRGILEKARFSNISIIRTIGHYKQFFFISHKGNWLLWTKICSIFFKE